MNFSHKAITAMHNLKRNFDKFLSITKLFFENKLNKEGNFQTYRRVPKMNDAEIIALSFTCESLGIDSENYFFGKLKSDHLSDFQNLIDRSNFNRRRKRMYPMIVELNEKISQQLNADEDVYLIDSIPLPICQLAREKASKICKESFESAPDKGFSTVTKNYYYGYKLHIILSMRGIFHSMDISKASVHDIYYLEDIKQNMRLDSCLLIGDKGYLSNQYKIDLFTTCNINLATPVRNNQKEKADFPYIFKKQRRRIETYFAQLCDQFMLKRNYAKTLLGLSVRVLCKITSATCLQYLNSLTNKPINHLKFALAC